MVGSPHLAGTPEHILDTHPGQAHFALPNGTHTCRECQFWGNSLGRHRIGTMLRPAYCRKARQLTHTRTPAVPHNARECRHFRVSLLPPEI
jgi:hypothetical protein